jgi:precorrin-2/cobalt-factor-2 C20-methyltransferase
MNTQTGTLYGIGVGPGDPELLPLKAVRLLGEVDVVFAASSTKNSYSLAMDIAGPHIPETTPVVRLAFPMTRDRSETQKAWEEHARTIIDRLDKGENAAFITLGDPTTYSTYGYVLQNLRALRPDLPVETVPGITSYQASAARLNLPLVEGEESLLITSGVQGGQRLREMDNPPENIVFLKAYRNAADICDALEENGLVENSVGISRCGLPEEEIIRDVCDFRKRPPGYWTIILAKRNRPAT